MTSCEKATASMLELGHAMQALGPLETIPIPQEN